MNRAFISRELATRGIPRWKIRFGWCGDAGPGIHIVGTTFFALLPLGDESDLEFVEFVYSEVMKEVVATRWQRWQEEKC